MRRLKPRQAPSTLIAEDLREGFERLADGLRFGGVLFAQRFAPSKSAIHRQISRAI